MILGSEFPAFYSSILVFPHSPNSALFIAVFLKNKFFSPLKYEQYILKETSLWRNYFFSFHTTASFYYIKIMTKHLFFPTLISWTHVCARFSHHWESSGKFKLLILGSVCSWWCWWWVLQTAGSEMSRTKLSCPLMEYSGFLRETLLLSWFWSFCHHFWLLPCLKGNKRQKIYNGTS